MSTDTQQLNSQESSAQTPIILEAGQRVTAKIKDIQSFVEPVNALLKPEKHLTNVVSLSEITQALIPANLNLKDEIIELNPKVGETVSTIVELDENSEYIGFNSITVRTKPLENRVVPILTPAMLNAEGGLTITKTSDDFCGMNQVEIQDIALASNIEYTITDSDLTNKIDGNYVVNFDFVGSSTSSAFKNFSTEVKERYLDNQGYSTVFGAKDLIINVPLVEYHEFTVDTKTLNKTFIPADIPTDFDGTGGSAGKIGFKQIKVSATLKSTLTANKLITAAKSGGGKKYSIGSDKVESEDDVQGLGIGYPAVEIPPITAASIPIEPYTILGPGYFSLDSTNSWENLNNFIGSGIESPYAIDSVNLNFNSSVIQQLTENSDLFPISGEFNIRDIYSSGLSIIYNVHPYFGDISGYYSWDNTNSTNVFFNSSVLSSTIKNVTTGFNLINNITLPCAPVLNLRVSYDNFQSWRSNTTAEKKTFAEYLSTNYSALDKKTGNALLDHLTIKLTKSSNYVFFKASDKSVELDVTSSIAKVTIDDSKTYNIIEKGDNPFEEYKVRLEQSVESYNDCLIIACVSSSSSPNSAITINNIKHRKHVIHMPRVFPNTEQKSFSASVLLNKSEVPLKNALFFISGYSSTVDVYVGVENNNFSITWTKLETESSENKPYLWSNSDKTALAVCMYGDIAKTSFAYKPCFFYITDASNPTLPNSAS